MLQLWECTEPHNLYSYLEDVLGLLSDLNWYLNFYYFERQLRVTVKAAVPASFQTWRGAPWQIHGSRSSFLTYACFHTVKVSLARDPVHVTALYEK